MFENVHGNPASEMNQALNIPARKGAGPKNQWAGPELLKGARSFWAELLRHVHVCCLGDVSGHNLVMKFDKY